MPFFCTNCGEEENFTKTYWKRVYHDVTEHVKNEGDTEEIWDIQETDNDGPEDEQFFCRECEAKVEELDDDEILREKVLHTDEDENWCKDELPEDKQNEELKKELIARQI